MSNPALDAGSDLNGHHDALSTEGEVYIQISTPRAALYGIPLSSKCGSMVGGGLLGRNSILRLMKAAAGPSDVDLCM